MVAIFGLQEGDVIADLVDWDDAWCVGEGDDPDIDAVFFFFKRVADVIFCGAQHGFWDGGAFVGDVDDGEAVRFLNFFDIDESQNDTGEEKDANDQA